jgi:hypothetical protein
MNSAWLLLQRRSFRGAPLFCRITRVWTNVFPAALVFTVYAAGCCSAIAQSKAAAPLCSKDGVVCVAGSLAGSLISNPIRVDLEVTSAEYVDLAWELRDGTGNVIQSSSTYNHMDWPDERIPLHRTFHVVDFILKPAASSRGTLTISPLTEDGLPEGDKSLSAVVLPVRLNTDESSITVFEPAKEDAFDDDFFSRAFSGHTDLNRTNAGRAKIPFKADRLRVMHFEPRDLVGITAAAVLERNPGQSVWYLIHWGRVGSTAHVTIQGSAWAGVSFYFVTLDYILRRNMLALPGIHHFVWDSSR